MTKNTLASLRRLAKTIYLQDRKIERLEKGLATSHTISVRRKKKFVKGVKNKI